MGGNYTYGDFVMYINVESLYCTPEMNIMLHLNFFKKGSASVLVV